MSGMIYLHSNHESCLRVPPDTATARFHSRPEPALGDLFNGCCSMGEAGAKRREAAAARSGDTACSSLAPASASSSSSSPWSSSPTGSPFPWEANTNTPVTSTSAPGPGHRDGASPSDTSGSDPEAVESPAPPPMPVPSSGSSSGGTEPAALEEFTDVSLKGNRRRSAPEQLAAGLECAGPALGNEQGAKPKKLSIADYISRELFSAIHGICRNFP
ncbi:hypothetical protein chiPu_0004407, partial [Chiloscyllium punctatum]|nr:hypothetical protein [Chiloscyllium punctatum]